VARKVEIEEEDGPKGAPEWVVTFTDMISLLVTFFVLLMTFSSIDAYEALRVDSWLSANRGIHKQSGFALPDLGKDDVLSATSIERGALRPHARPPEHLPDSLQEMGQRLTEEHHEVDLNEINDGLVIEFGDEASFDPGSTELSDDLRLSLGEIARVLQNYPHLIVVEGFTDGAHRPTERYPTADSLSVARANAAARHMLRASQLTPELLQVSGHGARRPRADNVSPGGRRMNRRVRLRILSLSKVRANHLAVRAGGGD
jgi:chemotaxis protein MotB